MKEEHLVEVQTIKMLFRMEGIQAGQPLAPTVNHRNPRDFWEPLLCFADALSVFSALRPLRDGLSSTLPALTVNSVSPHRQNHNFSHFHPSFLTV